MRKRRLRAGLGFCIQPQAHEARNTKWQGASGHSEAALLGRAKTMTLVRPRGGTRRWEDLSRFNLLPEPPNMATGGVRAPQQGWGAGQQGTGKYLWGISKSLASKVELV